MKYFVFHFGDDDAEVSFEQFATKELLEKELNQSIEDESPTKFVVSCPKHAWDIGNSFPRGTLIIRGDIVCPKPIEKVTKVSLE